MQNPIRLEYINSMIQRLQGMVSKSETSVLPQNLQ